MQSRIGWHICFRSRHCDGSSIVRPAGSIRARTRLFSAGQDAEYAWVRVSDTGPSIPAEEQEEIFKPFYRGAHGKRIKQGLGLGMSIARDIAEAHGGKITLISEPGQGSQFTLWLPLNYP